jgi:23S rRNA pseudouridine2605 synthase/16S rRNA pseudouridine516 synthase
MPSRLRLNKYLRDCRLGSRRKCEELIRQGRVKLNGAVVVEVGTLVDTGADLVEVDGEAVRPFTESVYVVANKPRGVVVTGSDPQGRKTFYDAIRGLPEGLFSVGRLDMDSEGLLLLTNDGKLAFRLSHPRHEIEKVYHVGLDRPVDRDLIASLKGGIELEDGPARAREARVLKSGDNPTLELTLTEGRKREIRRMMAACGYGTWWLRRVRLGTLELGDLKPGAWRHLERDEVRGLRRLVEEAYVKKMRKRRQ